MSRTTVIQLCPVHSKKTHILRHKLARKELTRCKENCRERGDGIEHSICASGGTSQCDVKEGLLWGIFLFIANKTADYCSKLLPEPVPVVGQNKQPIKS